MRTRKYISTRYSKYTYSKTMSPSVPYITGSELLYMSRIVYTIVDKYCAGRTRTVPGKILRHANAYKTLYDGCAFWTLCSEITKVDQKCQKYQLTTLIIGY